MEIPSALLALWESDPSVAGGFAQRACDAELFMTSRLSCDVAVISTFVLNKVFIWFALLVVRVARYWQIFMYTDIKP